MLVSEKIKRQKEKFSGKNNRGTCGFRRQDAEKIRLLPKNIQETYNFFDNGVEIRMKLWQITIYSYLKAILTKKTAGEENEIYR